MSTLEMKFTIALTIAIRDGVVINMQDAILFRDNYNNEFYPVSKLTLCRIYNEVAEHPFKN